MISTILHVEDDFALRAVVTVMFENLGFRGNIVAVDTVRHAIRILDERAREGNTFDLIIADMHLPDGSGLDVVRHVRSSPSSRFTPVLILSGDVDPKKVSRAYALGANSYIDKSPAGRSLGDVLRSLYQHWAKDAVMPRAHEPLAIQQSIARAMDIRARHAQLYQRIADNFTDTPSESAFWLSRSLAESNLANLLAFVQHTLVAHDESDDVIDAIENMQSDVERALSVAEHEVERGPIAHLDAYRLVVHLLSMMNIEALSKSIGYLFPMMPAAMIALRDYLISTVHDVAAWIDLHTNDSTLREQTARLRADAAMLFKHDPTTTEHAQMTLH